MEYSNTPEEDVREFLQEALEDYIGLWQIVRRAGERSTSSIEILSDSLNVVESLLNHGLQAGNLIGDGGFSAWTQQDVGYVLNRIQREWLALDRLPNIGDIAWFYLPRGRT